MNLGDVKYGLRTIDLLEVPNDFENGGLSPVDMQTCLARPTTSAISLPI
jgi:hypothetical protein